MNTRVFLCVFFWPTKKTKWMKLGQKVNLQVIFEYLLKQWTKLENIVCDGFNVKVKGQSDDTKVLKLRWLEWDGSPISTTIYPTSHTLGCDFAEWLE